MSPQPVTPAAKMASRRRPPGLLLRGNLYSLRLKVPKALQASLGRTHVCRALGTGRLNEAVRRARVVAGEIEASWAAPSPPVVHTPPPAVPAAPPIAPSPSAVVAPGPTLQMALEGYLADPGRRRHAKSAKVYQAHSVGRRLLADARHARRHAALDPDPRRWPAADRSVAGLAG